MKINILTNALKAFVCYCLLFSGTPVIAQKIIDNPLVGFDGKNPNVKVTKVVLTDTATVLHFTTNFNPGNWINIPKTSYIQINDNNKKLFIKNTIGIPLNKQFTMPKSGVTSYQLVFPKIEPTTNAIDYGEDADGAWMIYDIELNGKKPPLPLSLYTEWYDTKTRDLKIAFYNKAVVLNKKVWSYQKVTKSSNGYLLTLKNNQQVKQLTVKSSNPQSLSIILDGKSTLLSSQPETCAQLLETDTFKTPVLNASDAILSGYIKNYSPKLKTNTLLLAVDDVITGKQESILIEIQPNGYFSKKIRANHFKQVFLSSEITDENNIYLEPGKELFVIIGSGIPKYQGELSQINRQLASLEKINQFNYDTIQKKVAKMTPLDYKNYLTELQQIELKKLDSIYSLHQISPRAFQVKKIGIPIEYACHIMEYHWRYETGYRRANKVSDKTKIEIPLYPESYFNSMITQFFNNDLNLIAGYDRYVNRVKYLNVLLPSYKYYYRDLITSLKSNGYVMKENDINFEKIILLGKGEFISSKENKHADSLVMDAFFKTHKDFAIKFGEKFRDRAFSTKLDSAFGIKNGILLDVIRAQDIGRTIVQELTPIDKTEFNNVVAVIDNKFVKDYLAYRNDLTIKQIEANKKNSDFFVNQTPNVKADQTFEAIIEKHKGKVVLIDFWATWCGPCLSGIERIKPLKEELKDSDVVFLYITNQTSPEQTYKNMIPTIKGQHYRVKSDEWNYLAQKFNISGIPHMVLVNKEGKVVNPHLAFEENSALKSMIKKHL